MILLFATLIYIGYSLSKSCKDLFASYLSFGFTSLLMVQVFINIAVVIGLIPVTGVTLPFISYGGSSLVISMFMMGIIVNIMKNGEKYLDFEYKNEKKIKLPFLAKFLLISILFTNYININNQNKILK